MSSHMIRGKRVILEGTADPKKKSEFLKWLDDKLDWSQRIIITEMWRDADALYFEPVKDSTGFIVTWRESHRNVRGKNRRVRIHI